MKRIVTILAALFLVGTGFTAAKLFTVRASVDEWNNVLYVIDQSDAPAKQRNAARDLIMGQVQKQLTDTTSKR